MESTSSHPASYSPEEESTIDHPASYSPSEDSDESHEYRDEDRAALQQKADIALGSFIANHPPSGVPARTAPPPRLRNPVVIPQRRPGNKERGFIRAYAPDLEEFGIDQDSFLAFIDASNQAIQASKWIVAIQVAALGAGFVPNHISLGVTAAVQISAAVLSKANIRWKTNSFMDRMNDEFFRPRGLYCLLMAYNPISTGAETKVDPEQTIESRKTPLSPSASRFSKAKRNLRNPTDGTSQGADNLPPSVAPLVFPDTAKTGQQRSDAKTKKAFDRLNNYFDRRAQARYAAESKGDVLSSAPQKPFSNRYLDPNHPANNGGLLGLLSGGKLTQVVEKQKLQMKSAMAAQEQAVRDQQSAQMAQMGTALQGMGLTPEQQRDYVRQYETAYAQQLQQFQQQSEMLEHGQRKINKNILYLMVVNMPTAAEMEEATKQAPISGDGQIGDDVKISSVDVE